MQDFMDCIMSLDSDDCEGLDDCMEIWGDIDAGGDETGDTDFDNDQDGEGDDLETPDAGEQEFSSNAAGVGCSAAPANHETAFSLIWIALTLTDSL
jgi:hypothetical protein